MSGIGRISGPLLKDNLLRNGVDLSFETDLLYLDVNTTKIGIKTDSSSRELEIATHVQTTTLLVDDLIRVADLEVNDASEISSLLDPIYLNAGTSIHAPALTVDNIKIDNNRIETLGANSHLELRPTNRLVINSNTFVDASVHATGDVTFDGEITFGSDDLDSVTFNADIASNLNPDVTNTYALGSTDKKWNKLYSQAIRGANVVVSEISSPANITFSLRFSNSIFVSTNGSNSNQGDHYNAPYRNINYALSQAVSGDTVYIFPGTYSEIFPLTVPTGVTVIGYDIRQTVIVPTELTKSNDAFLLNGECTVSDLTVKNFFYNIDNDTGHAFRFAPDFTVTSRSPYVQNVTVITAELPASSLPTDITVGPAPTGVSLTSDSVTLPKSFYSQSLVDSLVGQTAVIDRYPLAPLFYTVVSIETEPLSPTEWRMTVDTAFAPTGQLKPISFYPDVETTLIITNDIWDTTGNSVGEKWVAYYKTGLPPFFPTTVEAGWTINVAGTIYIVDYVIEDPVNTNMWRIYVTTSLVAGVGIPIFSSPTVGISVPAGKGAYIDGSVATASSKEASMLFHSCTFITPGVDCITMSNGVRVEWLNSFTYFALRGLYAVNGYLGFASLGVKYGAELRSIGSANVYGTYGAVADGSATLMYLVNHNFGYIGSNLDSSNDNTLVIQENEVVEIAAGKIYYTSQSQDGSFKVGDQFFVDLAKGTVSFDTFGIASNGISDIVITGINSRTFIDANKIETDDFRLSGNTIETLTRSFDILSASTAINFTQDVSASKNIVITGDFQTEGTLTLGNQAQDTVVINTNLSQNLNPKVNNTYNLGTLTPASKVWKDIYLDGIITSDVKVSASRIETTVSGSNLEFVGSGTGIVKVESLLFGTGSITSSVTDSNLTLTSNSDYGVSITGSLAVKVPNTSVVLDNTGSLRFNPVTGIYQGYSSATAGLGGVYSADTRTTVLAHPTNNTLLFTVNTSTVASLQSTGLITNALQVSDILINSNSITSSSNLDLNIVADAVNIQALTIQDGDITSSTGQNVELGNTGNGYTHFTGETAVQIPSGDDSTRPVNPIVGNTRLNIEREYIEVWNGTEWIPVTGTGEIATFEYANEQTTFWSLVLG